MTATASSRGAPDASVGLATNPFFNRLCVWAGPAFVVFYSAGILVAGLFPPPSPTSDAAQIVELYGSHANEMRLGCILMAFGAGFIAPWAVAVATQMRRSELGSPVLTYSALASAFFVAIDASLIPTLWALATFRAGRITPDITVTLNDLGWFLFMFPWQLGGGIWFIAVALSILGPSNEKRIYPRWLGWMSLWFCLLTLSDSLVPFFKSGPFAYNGIFTFYVPFTILLVWVICLTVETTRAINRQQDTEGKVFVPQQ